MDLQVVLRARWRALRMVVQVSLISGVFWYTRAKDPCSSLPYQSKQAPSRSS
jgi:hypothetical protein